MGKFKFSQLWLFVSIIFIFMLMGTETAFVQQVPPGMALERGIFFSTEEDFVAGIQTGDGNPIISDGDLLHSSGYVYMRNHELLEKCCRVHYDLGLDAADVIDVKKKIVAFSTELDDPNGSFKAGDLLFTNGASLPNFVLLKSFKIPRHLDLGLDAVQFIGKKDDIIEFIDAVREKGKRYWIEKPEMLTVHLKKLDIDIWFSTEGTAPKPNDPGFLDGDLLSAKTGTIVLKNHDALLPPIPAGIPDRGVDFGMDAAACIKREKEGPIYFSTEILYEDRLNITDGDVLKAGNGVVMTNNMLVHLFEPKAEFLGLDALCIGVGGIALRPQITHFSQVSVNDINNSGLALSTERPFGMWIQIHGHIPDDVDQFRVVFCKASDWPCIGMTDGIEVTATQDWVVNDNDGVGGCTADWHWYSLDADGWFDASNYRELRDCTPDLPLTMWNSQTAPDPNGLYLVWLQWRRGGFDYNEFPKHYIQLDNKAPEYLDVKPKNGTICGQFGPGDMPIMVQARFFDYHFYWYRLHISGGFPWAIKYYDKVYHYSSTTDFVGPTGTGPPPPPPPIVDLHEVNVNDLPAASVVECAYKVGLWVHDRTIRGGFDPPNDFRPIYFYGWHSYVEFTFDYTP